VAAVESIQHRCRASEEKWRQSSRRRQFDHRCHLDHLIDIEVPGLSIEWPEGEKVDFGQTSR
jgi:hypothetical protein